jgi:hypothetical protein
MPSRLSSAAGFPPLRVTFFRRMKQARVYPVTVSWTDLPRPVGGVKNVTLRLLAAGAQVVPSEQALDATRPDLKATFFVTPLVRGWLRAQRLEVVVAGRKVQEIPIASHVTCQCWAGFWFLMAVAAPIFLIWLRGYDPEIVTANLRRHIIPALPAALTESAPNLADAWETLWAWKTNAIEHFLAFNRDHLVAFPTGIACLALSLISLIAHRDVKSKRTSDPIAVPTGGEAG